jgi:hypothetical protein
MEGSGGLFTSSSTGNGETRQKRMMRINEWANLKHKALRESENTHISKTGQKYYHWELNKDIAKQQMFPMQFSHK